LAASPSSDPRPSLVLVTHEFYPHRGGIAVYAAEMARAAHELGYSVEVWAPALPAGQAEPEWPFQVRRLPLAGDHSLLSQWRMARALSASADHLRNSILYIPEPGPVLAMLLLQYFDTIRPARLALTFHGSEIQRLASRWLLRWSTSHLLAKASRISVVSRYARDLLDRHFPESTEKVVVTPGQLEVINALKALPPAKRAMIEYWLVGAHGKENYDQLLADAGAAADFPVRFLGDIPDDKLSELYAQADIFAMTSMPHKHSVEGFGLVYLEAGAHGLPIVAHAIGGVPEAVIDGYTGLLVAPGDTSALTAAFSRLIDDPILRRNLGEAGRSRALARSWQDSAIALFGQRAAPGSE
jgi:glycosyltransferase involved in cell wall biosynthesis